MDNRLKRVMDFIEGDTLVDIGSDHAYLPINAYRNGLIKRAICGEIQTGPYESTVKNIREHGLGAHIEARLGDGLTILNDESADTITICGMGGPLIALILREGFSHVKNKPRLVLQANTYTMPIRRTITALGYRITSEDIVQEGRRFYEIIVCDTADEIMSYSDAELRYGPCNLQEKSRVFMDYLKREQDHQQRILDGITDHQKNRDKVDELIHNITQIEEVLNSESK